MSEIYVQRGDQKVGPFTTEELEGKVAGGELSPEDLFWSEGMEEWQPLSTVITIETQDDVGEISDPEDDGGDVEALAQEGTAILHEIADTTITTHALHLPCGEVIAFENIVKAGVQTETIRRFKPVALCIVVGVAIVCLALAEIPRTNLTHWVFWGVVLIGLLLWWVRLFLDTLRVGSSMVVIDLKDGDERIIRANPETVVELHEAIALSLPETE
jgi:hypothetical protein